MLISMDKIVIKTNCEGCLNMIMTLLSYPGEAKYSPGRMHPGDNAHTFKVIVEKEV